LTERILSVAGHKLVALALANEQCDHPFILIHGINASVSYWLSDPLFLKQNHCYALSLPGHYPAVFPPNFRDDQFTSEEIARVMAQAIRELAPDRSVTLVGHSTGGFAALAIAAYSPELVARVVCISGFVQGELNGILGLCQRLVRSGPAGRALCRMGFKVLAINRMLFRQSLQSCAYNKKKFLAYPGLDAFVDHSYRDYKRLDLNAIFLYFRVLAKLDISHLLPQIKRPVLALVGDHDPIVAPTQSKLIASSLSNADLVTLKGVGHVPSFECQAEYQQKISSWLAKTKVDEKGKSGRRQSYQN
jgi:pimeloyl-ACP methyl ester carboxylesterase